VVRIFGTDTSFTRALKLSALRRLPSTKAVAKGLGARYLASFSAAMERVCRDPKQFRIECEPDLRRIALRRIVAARLP
jgi:hypothetical protein